MQDEKKQTKVQINGTKSEIVVRNRCSTSNGSRALILLNQNLRVTKTRNIKQYLENLLIDPENNKGEDMPEFVRFNTT